MGDLIALILKEAPSFVQLIQERYAATHKNEDPLTAEQVVAAFEEAFTSTIAKDELIKAWIAAS